MSLAMKYVFAFGSFCTTQSFVSYFTVATFYLCLGYDGKRTTVTLLRGDFLGLHFENKCFPNQSLPFTNVLRICVLFN